MLIKSALYLFILLLPADLQTIADNLSSNEYKVRKSALIEAKKLNAEKKRILIKALKKSNDPELTETAKELSLHLPEALSKNSILKDLLENNLEPIKKALKINPKVFHGPYINQLTILDIAIILERKKAIDLFQEAGIKSSDNKYSTMEVLLVENDSWESLAQDFNSDPKLIKLINNNIELAPGKVIKVLRVK